MRQHSALILVGALTLVAGNLALAGSHLPNLKPFANAHGNAQTFTRAGKVDLSNPFFQSLGSNGRACVTCHDPSAGWSITPEFAQARFEATDGLDPLFRAIDGTNSPTGDLSTALARRDACSMLLRKGLIRVGLPMPTNAEFELIASDDPYGHAGERELSLFRRPLPTTNLRFVSALMWDGRETAVDPTVADPTLALDLHTSLLRQANGATLGHAEAFQDLTAQQQRQITAFQLELTTAQAEETAAGNLGTRGADGGPMPLTKQRFYLGINDPLGHNPSGEPFNPRAFTLFDKWKNSPSPAQRAVFRGQELFNTQPIRITDVKGLNDDLGAPLIMGTCTTCHDTPNVGNHSAIAPLDIGLTDVSRRTPDMPLYTLRNRTTHEVVQSTDPGRALITGKWKDIGRFKGPILRGLAARAPYFHNGSAATLEDTVNFYDTRFNIGLTAAQRADIAAFLKAL